MPLRPQHPEYPKASRIDPGDQVTRKQLMDQLNVESMSDITDRMFGNCFDELFR
jgi:hypothetical protein